MELTDYGLWILFYEQVDDTTHPTDVFPPTPDMKMGDLPYSIYCLEWRGTEILWVQVEDDAYSFYIHDPVFNSLNRTLDYNEDLSNQRFLKVVRRVIKRYKNAIASNLASSKSKFNKDLDTLLEEVCI